MAILERDSVTRVVTAPRRALQVLGDHGIFYLRVLGNCHRAVVSYKREVIRLVAEIAMGTGALAIIGGSVVVMAFLTMATGATVTVEGAVQLENIGVEALTGFFSAFVNTRIAAPAIAGIVLSATIGAGSTAQLGAMRISEEIDALEVMAIRSLPYLVSTRVVAGVIAVIPLYSIALLMSVVSSKITAIYFYDQSEGAYDHYFETFLIPRDVLYSFLQVIFAAIAVMLIHTYYGYHAAGGPVGVGEAVGKSVRASLVAVLTIVLLVAFAAYGTDGGFNLSG